MVKNGVIVGAGGVVVGLVAGFLLFSPPINTSVGMENDMDKMGTMEDMFEQHHSHAMLEVSADVPAPEIEVEVIKDKMDGYNIHIKTKNYKFSPEGVNEAVVQNEGHAHIFVNGKKVSRLYGDWYHLSGDNLREGENMIEVTLNANNHSEWTKNGEHISAMAKVVQ